MPRKKPIEMRTRPYTALDGLMWWISVCLGAAGFAFLIWLIVVGFQKIMELVMP